MIKNRIWKRIAALGCCLLTGAGLFSGCMAQPVGAAAADGGIVTVSQSARWTDLENFHLSERFLEKCRSQPFIPVVVVLPQGDKQQLVIIQCFHICSFLSKTSAYMGRHFYFLMSFQSVFRGLRQGLAKENTAAKRG